MSLRILVAQRPGDGFTPAALRARELAQASSTPVDVCLCSVLFDAHIADHRAGDHSPVTAMREAMIRAEEETLENVAGHIQGVCKSITQQVCWGDPVADELIKAAAEFRADIVIATTHTHSRLSHMLFTPTDWDLLRQCPIPVLFAHYQSFRPYKKALVAVDPIHVWDRSAQLDNELIRAAKRLSVPFAGEVFLGNAYPVPGLCVMAEYSPPGDIFEQWRGEHKAAVAKLAEANDIDAAHVRLLADHPKHAIPKLVETVDADLVVMGSVSRRHRRRLVAQNAGYVLDHIDRDVLVVGCEPTGNLVAAFE